MDVPLVLIRAHEPRRSRSRFLQQPLVVLALVQDSTVMAPSNILAIKSNSTSLSSCEYGVRSWCH